MTMNQQPGGHRPWPPDATGSSAKEPATQPVRVSAGWLAVREPADAAARSVDLVELLARDRPVGPWVIHDLGSGTGSMARWLAPQLNGEQRWILYDRDPDLLTRAAMRVPAAADGGAVRVETRIRDITRLAAAELAGASLITASALLDMFSSDELDRFVTSCAVAQCPVLLSMSVIGRVQLSPADPLDEHLSDAFNAHQRRAVGDRRLLGPDAVGVAASVFARLGYDVLIRPSPWRLGPATVDLLAQWLSGWLAVAARQRPDLDAAISGYRRRRQHQAAIGELAVVVHHHDLLAVPR